MSIDELNIPEGLHSRIPSKYTIGVELDLIAVVKLFPVDFGHKVFANHINTPFNTEGAMYFVNLFTDLENALLILTMKPGLGGGMLYDKCFVLTQDTEEFRRELVMMKLKY